MLENKINNDRGSTTVLVALLITAFMVCCALVIDVGLAYVQLAKLQKAVDAAALAGAQELPDTSDALDAANQYFAANGFNPSDMNVDFSNGATTINVTGDKTVNFYFARVIGFNSKILEATAEANLSTVGGASGVVPLGVEQQDFIYGDTYTLKEGGGDGHTGNYGALALGGNGASVYLKNLKYGYSGMLKVGQSVNTEPGNMRGPTDSGAYYRIHQDPTATFDDVQTGSPRIVVLPVMETMDVNGRKPVTIVGFAVFFLERCGDGEITGEFMQMGVSSSIPGSGPDFGAYNLRLTK
ncbi:MAG: pilus assembly protein TadG-related protein [Chitinophagales bacterium]